MRLELFVIFFFFFFCKLRHLPGWVWTTPKILAYTPSVMSPCCIAGWMHVLSSCGLADPHTQFWRLLNVCVETWISHSFPSPICPLGNFSHPLSGLATGFLDLTKDPQAFWRRYKLPALYCLCPSFLPSPAASRTFSPFNLLHSFAKEHRKYLRVQI